MSTDNILAAVTVGDRHADVTFTVSATDLGLDANGCYWAGLAAYDAIRGVLVDNHDGDASVAIIFVFTSRTSRVSFTNGNTPDALFADIALAASTAIAEYIAAYAADAA